jgi:hypothetical protein
MTSKKTLTQAISDLRLRNRAMEKEPRAKLELNKVLISFAVVLPLCIVVGGLSILAFCIGIASLPLGIFLVALAALGALFLYGMVVSLWLDRPNSSIVFGLLAGSVILGIGAYNIIDDAMSRSPSGIIWTTENYVETYGLGPLAVAGIILSVYLLVRRLPRGPETRPPRAPILVRRPSISPVDPLSSTEQPTRGPYLPSRHETKS